MSEGITTNYLCTPTSVWVDKKQKGTVKEKLPPAVYQVAFDEFRGFYLIPVSNNFSLPAKLYGVEEMPVQEILSAYQRSNKQMGVLLAGTKGAGKTLLSQIVCNHLIKDFEVPVVLVDTKFYGQAFFNFMNDLGEVAVVFDEFAKVYGDEQEAMLTFFDGANVQCKRMAIVIENDIHDVNSFMIDRPSRFMFRLTYDSISATVIDEMCKDYGIDDTTTRDIKSYTGNVDNLSTDVLKSLLNYITETSCTVEQALSLLNIPVSLDFSSYTNTPIIIKAVVDLKTGKKDSTILSGQSAFINGSAVKFNRIDDDMHSSFLKDLKNHITRTNKDLSEKGEPLLTDESIDVIRKSLLLGYTNTIYSSVTRHNVVKQYRPETNDFVLVLPDEEVALVYAELPELDLEELLKSL